MPQMNPMWWFSLFLIFVTTLTISNSLNYFYSNNSLSSSSLTNKNTINVNWKW
uniref:ATP synthase complex subunit 8 n=1 Tax=Longivalvus hyalospilus TaxID=1264640 RepID=M9P716_9NEOP|nr:ATP synthase F0 subunit 8 [Longivalvus hyalospilus]